MTSTLGSIESQMLTDLNVTAASGLDAAYNGPLDKLPDTYPYAEVVFGDAEIISTWDANQYILRRRAVQIEIKAKDSEDVNLALQKLGYLYCKQPYRGQMQALGVTDIKAEVDSTTCEVDDENMELNGTLLYTVEYYELVS